MKRHNAVILSILVVLVSILFIISLPSNAVAVSEIRVPELDESQKSLTVYFYIQKTGVDTPIEGAAVGITRVASLKVNNGSAEYALLDAYKEANIEFAGMDVDESIKAAKKLSSIVSERESVAITDSQGKSIFSGLEPGMYLVEELDAHGDAEKYKLFDPYIISVPLADTTETVCKWKNNVISEPKTKIQEKQVSEPSEISEPSESSEYSEPSESSESSEPSEFSEVSEPSQTSEPSDDSKIITGENSLWFVILGIWILSLLMTLVIVAKRNGHESKE